MMQKNEKREQKRTMEADHFHSRHFHLLCMTDLTDPRSAADARQQ